MSWNIVNKIVLRVTIPMTVSVCYVINCGKSSGKVDFITERGSKVLVIRGGI
jgi:hypothetical protein